MSEKFLIDQSAVRQLTKLLNDSGLTEIEYQQGSSRIRVVKEEKTALLSSTPPPSLTPLINAGPPLSPEKLEESALGEPIPSPMVGTTYVAPEPNAPPYVRVGDKIQKGQILLIIEAMKVMNPIRAPRAGTITKICITDASPVEFGEALLYLS